jgi:hypothetical protein
MHGVSVDPGGMIDIANATEHYALVVTIGLPNPSKSV